MTRKSVAKLLSKALSVGVAAALKEAPPGRESMLTEEAKAWVVHWACSKPKEFGYAAEGWSRQARAQHVRQQAVAAGQGCLSRASKATGQRLLAAQPRHPHQVTVYRDRRDPAFDSKRRDVLMGYQAVHLPNHRLAEGRPEPPVITVSVDDKPGVQAIATTRPDLPPVPGRYPGLARDYEYRRLGTGSILAALDLPTGQVTARVERRHRRRIFIALLKDLDAYYPPDCTSRLIRDNHSAQVSKETQAFLAPRPNRFKYSHTPTHGSWLNRVDTLFGKRARTFLRHIRVQSWEELRDRILHGIAEINAAPVVHRWKKFNPLNA